MTEQIDKDSMVLLSASYDGIQKKAFLKFYDEKTDTIKLWYDNTEHKPYCLIKKGIDEKLLESIKNENKILAVEETTKIDLLNDKEENMLKIIADDPLQIISIRDRVPAWEADIKYYETYMYDKSLIPGIYYKIRNNQIIPTKFTTPKETNEMLQKGIENADIDIKNKINEWAELLSQPLPKIKRVALDIEVHSDKADRFPDADEARYPIISVGFAASDGFNQVCILRREGIETGINELEKNIEVVFVDDEKSLIESVFRVIEGYPCIITYNGDDFDLKYIYNRAIKSGIKKDNIPIQIPGLGRVSRGKNFNKTIEANLKQGIHLDLYRTFLNKSIQIYAFGNKYSEHSLNAVSSAIIGKTKIEYEGEIGEQTYYHLAKYNHNDAAITLELTSFDGDLLMKLLLVLSRITKMPINDLSRIGVSNWIRSMIYFEHRKINALIPRKDELAIQEDELKKMSSEAMIEGKQYQGGMVLEPKIGVYFGVSALDFASLYPSIIKVNNLSYETVRCKHKEHQSNLIKGSKHWVCNTRRGIISLLVGSLRDIRVNYYKPLPKMSGLSSDERNLYSVISQALKVILNASYGVLGSPIFPLFFLPVADSTAAIGRNIITETVAAAKEKNIDVLYGDTDSLFIKSIDQNEIDGLIKWSHENQGVDLELEDKYRYAVFSERKKNYIVVKNNGQVIIKGLTGKKSHIPLFVREAFYEAIDKLGEAKTEKDFESVKTEIRNIAKESNNRLKEDKVPIEKLAFKMMMSKSTKMYKTTIPQHVRAAKLLEEYNRKNGDTEGMKAGDIISFVKTIGNEGVKPLKLAKIRDIDKKKYEEIMRSTFDQLLGPLGYSFDDVLGVTKLEDLFWNSDSKK
ncbi:MAG: DNA-directed DNA polymerase I [Nitrososphaerales archaeon]|nr:DNA-directed DNA polymerase I [Nitrososphaerales archaeon]